MVAPHKVRGAPLEGTTPELVARVKCLLVGPVSLAQSTHRDNIQNTNQHPRDSQH